MAWSHWCWEEEAERGEKDRKTARKRRKGWRRKPADWIAKVRD